MHANIINQFFERFLPGYYHWMVVAGVVVIALLILGNVLSAEMLSRRARGLLSAGIVAVAVCLVVWILDRTPQDEAISKLRQLGAWAEVDRTKPGKPIVKVTFQRYKVLTSDRTEAFAACLKELPDLEKVDFKTIFPSEAVLAVLKKQFPKVEFTASEAPEMPWHTEEARKDRARQIKAFHEAYEGLTQPAQGADAIE